MTLAGAAEVVATLSLWMFLPIYCLFRGWLITAGLLSLAGFLLPAFLDGGSADDTPGLGMLMIPMAPLTLLFVGVGLISLLARVTRMVLGDRTDEIGL